MKAALTARIAPSTRLFSVAAVWAFLGRVCLINTFNRDSSELGFVLDHPSKLAIGPLVEALVHLLAIVNPITDAASIADCDRRDTSFKEHLHGLPRQFVKEIRDLVIDVVQLFLLRLDQLIPAIRTALFAVYLRVELGLEAVLIVTKGSKLTTVDREGIPAREDSGEVLLSEIDPGNLISGRPINGLCVILSTNDKTTRGLADLDGARFFTGGPVNQNRVVSTLRRQSKHTVISERDALVRPSEYVVGFVRALRRIALPVVVVPGANRFVELLGDLLGSLRGKHVVALTMPPSHRCFREPLVLSIYSSPVPLADRVPQIRRRARQPFKLLGALDMEFAGQVHASGLIFDILLDDLLTRFAGRADKVGAGPERWKSMQMVELVSKNVSTGSLESMDYLVGSVSSVCLDEEMNMIGPNRKGIDLPVMFFSHFMKHLSQAVCHFVFENTRPTFRAEHEVVLHRMDGVTASAIWFFVDWHRSINRLSCPVFRERSLTLRSTSHCEGVRVSPG
ncbi:hypothetical protein GGP48_003021 [Salinibacter ruber]|nr:hypothetical protein [Salinibacter ruber]MCS4188305.1 hypothetical protein [Salinibacter ruber]